MARLQGMPDGIYIRRNFAVNTAIISRKKYYISQDYGF
jgi:hypothetical protein